MHSSKQSVHWHRAADSNTPYTTSLSTLISLLLWITFGKDTHDNPSKRKLLEAQLLSASELRWELHYSINLERGNKLISIQPPKSIPKPLRIYKVTGYLDITWIFQTSASHRSSSKTAEDCLRNKSPYTHPRAVLVVSFTHASEVIYLHFIGCWFCTIT